MNVATRTSIVLWLLTGCFLIFLMVIIGGITRLTGSGLSITKWDVVTGTVPPLNNDDWIKEFNHYKETPQFEKINAHFGLEDFKQIYWWEYLHRLLGRVIGLVFIVPFAWFVVKKHIRGPLLYKCLMLFALGGLQGFLGWYMVKSGLVDNPSVSHYRLAVHLVTAFITFGFTFWFAFDLIHTQKIEASAWIKKLRYAVAGLFLIALVQIVFGAFVAGLKAGYIYNTWPLMDGVFIPEAVHFAFNNLTVNQVFSNLAAVQFIHRILAYVVVLAVVWIWIFIYRKQKYSDQRELTTGQVQAFHLIVIAVSVQFVLGVITLLLQVPVFMGVIHQAGAFLMFAAILYFSHRLFMMPVRISK